MSLSNFGKMLASHKVVFCIWYTCLTCVKLFGTQITKRVNKMQKEIKFQNVGYLRVSASDQSLSRQLEGVELDRVFEEKASGKNVKDRPMLLECLKYVRNGDVLHVHSMDRLARNLKDMLSLVEEINLKGVSITFHKEKMTFVPGASDPFASLMLSVIGACAEFERSIIKERQREGIDVALKSGVRFGVPKTIQKSQMPEIRLMLANGDGVSKVARKFGVSRQTIYRALKDGYFKK